MFLFKKIYSGKVELGLEYSRFPVRWLIIFSQMVLWFSWHSDAGSIQTITGQHLGKSYREATGEILDYLDKLGIESIACQNSVPNCLRVQDLRQNLDHIRIRSVANFIKPNSATRWGLFHSPAENIIYINESSEHFSDILGCLGLHELLGTFGQADLEYDFSLPACTLFYKAKANSLTSTNLIHLRELFNGRYMGPHRPVSANLEANSVLKVAGGATVFGGGGDPQGFMQRLLLYLYLEDSIATQRSFSTVHLGILLFTKKIEVIDSTANEVLFEFEEDYRGSRFDLPSEISVPRHLLSKKPLWMISAPNRAIEDIAHFYASIYPSSAPQFDIELVFYESIGPGGDWHVFQYPIDINKVHPVVMSEYYKKRWSHYCDSTSQCRRWIIK